MTGRKTGQRGGMRTYTRLVQEMKNVDNNDLLCCTKFGDTCMIIEQDIREVFAQRVRR